MQDVCLTTEVPGLCQAKNLDELLGFSTPMDHKKYDRYGAIFCMCSFRVCPLLPAWYSFAAGMCIAMHAVDVPMLAPQHEVAQHMGS